jgi:predicted hydrocarbon binding protein
MAKPGIQVQVDERTGRWQLDGVPVILVPQQWFLNNHFAIEAELGPERLEAVLRPAGQRSAYLWCEKEAAHHGLNGIDVFHHYIKRISQRGWGQFQVAHVSAQNGQAKLNVSNSAFVDEHRRGSGRKVCYMFAGWLEGSLQYATRDRKDLRKLVAKEISCSAEGYDHCTFSVGPAR